jgi:hypothetical protein
MLASNQQRLSNRAAISFRGCRRPRSTRRQDARGRHCLPQLGDYLMINPRRYVHGEPRQLRCQHGDCPSRTLSPMTRRASRQWRVGSCRRLLRFITSRAAASDHWVDDSPTHAALDRRRPTLLRLARIMHPFDLTRREVRISWDRFRISPDRGRAPSSPAMRQRSGKKMFAGLMGRVRFSGRHAPPVT